MLTIQKLFYSLSEMSRFFPFLPSPGEASALRLCFAAKENSRIKTASAVFSQMSSFFSPSLKIG